MVIQSNMSSKSIVEVWKETEEVFDNYNIPLTERTLETVVEANVLTSLIKDLNAIVGSSTVTCVKGG